MSAAAAIALIERTIKTRHAAGLGVTIFTEEHPNGWTAYAANVETRDRWIAQYRAKGIRAAIAKAEGRS